MAKFSEHGVAYLTEPRPGVPQAAEPFYWDRRLSVAANVGAIQHYINKYERMLPSSNLFDEAAIMVPNRAVEERLCNELTLGGWQEFNSAYDLVHTSPFGTRYIVTYKFYRHPAVPWRLEVMRLGHKATGDGLAGFSPLHQALWTDGDTPAWEDWAELPVPHLSFKPVGQDAGRAARRALDHMRNEMGFLLAQGCQSTYGEFWYLLHQDAPRQLYIKPRINRRDGA